MKYISIFLRQTGVCVCAFKKEENVQHLIDVTSIGGLSNFLLFFAILQRTATRGERNGKKKNLFFLWEELVSNDCCYLCYAATSPFCQLCLLMSTI